MDTTNVHYNNYARYNSREDPESVGALQAEKKKAAIVHSFCQNILKVPSPQHYIIPMHLYGTAKLHYMLYTFIALKFVYQ